MKIYISADMEGISGIMDRRQTVDDNKLFEEGRLYTTLEVNACVQGCFDGGATEVIVWDNHGWGKNFLWHELTQGAKYIIGNIGRRRMPEIDGSDGLILLGYHAMAGTPEAILEHTMSSTIVQNLLLNGNPIGEIMIDTGIASEYDVPAIMISGDNKACLEASNLVSGIITAQVKTSYTVNGGMLLSPGDAHNLIKEKAAEAVRNCKRFKPIQIKKPVVMRLEGAERCGLPIDTTRPYMKIIDSRTFEVSADSLEEAVFRSFYL